MAKPRTWIYLKLGLLSLLMLGCWPVVNAQMCRSPELRYIVRDSKGKIVDASTLDESSFTGEKAKYWKREVATISFTEPDRALGMDAQDSIVSFWIGSHADYDRLV
jgi:hypothetical protein